MTESNQEETFTCCLQDVEEFKDGDNLLELKSDKGNSVWIRCFDAVGYSACSPRCVASMWPYISHTCKSMASILAEKLASISHIVSLKNILKK